MDALAQQRLCNNVRDEIDSFLKGLNGIIPDNLLSIFDENELEVGVKQIFTHHCQNFILFTLQLLMCGTGEYSITDFRANHVANGNSTEFRRVLGWFWAAVGNFSRTEMARLLQFTTGCSQLPPGGFQVKYLSRISAMCIKKQRFPKLLKNLGPKGVGLTYTSKPSCCSQPFCLFYLNLHYYFNDFSYY